MGVVACGEDSHSHGDEQFLCDGDEDSLSPGTVKRTKNNTFEVEIVKSIPAEHYVQSNELIVTVKDSSGKLLKDVVFKEIEPFAKKHNHGTPITVKWEATANEGEYHLSEISYVHRGPWRVDVELSAGGVTDTFHWIFCVKELPGDSADAGDSSLVPSLSR